MKCQQIFPNELKVRFEFLVRTFLRPTAEEQEFGKKEFMTMHSYSHFNMLESQKRRASTFVGYQPPFFSTSPHRPVCANFIR
jgi:ATP-dependent phosphoenolpyruvate carboxykinase